MRGRDSLLTTSAAPEMIRGYKSTTSPNNKKVQTERAKQGRGKRWGLGGRALCDIVD